MNHCPSMEELAACIDAPGPMPPHLEECPRCAAILADLEADRVLLQSAPEIPESAYAALRAQIFQKVDRRERRRGPVWIGAAAAALALAASVVVFVVSLPPPSHRPVAGRQIAAKSARPYEAAETREPTRKPTRKPLITVASTKPARRARTVQPPLTASRGTSDQGRETNDKELLRLLDALSKPERQAPSFSGSMRVELQTDDPSVTIILLEGDDE